MIQNGKRKAANLCKISYLAEAISFRYYHHTLAPKIL